MATWDELRAVALRLPEVVEAEPRSWRVRDKGLAWERPLRKADLVALGADAPKGDIVGIHTVDLASRDELLVALPAVFFVTPHFHGYPAVLARLEALDVTVFERLVTDAWLARAPKRVVNAWRSSTRQA